MAVLDTQGNPLAPLETKNLPSPGKTPKTAARTPRSWPQPPAAPAPVPAIPKSPPPPPAMPKTPSPPSKAETPRATKAPTPATRASPSAAPRGAAKTRAASGSEPPEARETGVGAGVGDGADPLGDVNAVNDSTDSTDLTNAFDGAGTAAVNTTNITNTISGFPRENSKAAARKISDEVLAGSTVKGEKSEHGPVSPAAVQGPPQGTPETDDASANSQAAPFHASSAGGPSQDVFKPGFDDSSFSTAPAPAGDPAKPTAAVGRSGEDVKPKVSTEGVAATADPLGSKEDVTVKELDAGDKASPMSGKATTHEPPVKVEDEDSAKPGEKALPLPPPPPENPTAGSSGEAKAAAAPSPDKLGVEDNPWGLD
ncbi:hypothetical protein BD413DRAFT_680481 [Trametes elegans]|nr:hypothetical protein BD413DRAFT_680481 [Trametes elegans]